MEGLFLLLLSIIQDSVVIGSWQLSPSLKPGIRTKMPVSRTNWPLLSGILALWNCFVYELSELTAVSPTNRRQMAQKG
jgi:hypothetical protein